MPAARPRTLPRARSFLPAAAAVVAEVAVDAKTTERVTRLLVLVELRKVFRNCIRAESLLQQDSPVYTPAEPREWLGEGGGPVGRNESDPMPAGSRC
jgi:hypothetical protein